MALIFLVSTRAFNLVQAQSQRAPEERGKANRDVLPLSTAISDSIKKKLITKLQTSVRWESKEYGVDEGVEVLMSVIGDPDSDVVTRATAISRLGHLSTSLKNRDCLQQLRAYPRNSPDA